MMFSDLVKKSRSKRSFSSEARLTERTLLELCDVARYTRAAMNLQPLKYRLVTDEREVARMTEQTRWAASLTEKLHQIEIELTALRGTNHNATELAEEKVYLDHEIEALSKKWSAYMLAIESIERASGKLREGLSPKIASNAGRLMSLMSDGQYAAFGVDGDFALSYSDGAMMRDASSLSAGTGDLAYICLRIALIELLYKKAMPPLLFDESFTRMDDRRLRRVMLLLHKYASRKCQSILLSCHSRERLVSDEIGTYHSIRL
jgi:uncharacterized protein YhaN